MVAEFPYRRFVGRFCSLAPQRLWGNNTKRHKGIEFCVKIRSGVSAASPSVVSIHSWLYRRPVSATCVDGLLWSPKPRRNEAGKPLTFNSSIVNPSVPNLWGSSGVCAIGNQPQQSDGSYGQTGDIRESGLADGEGQGVKEEKLNRALQSNRDDSPSGRNGAEWGAGGRPGWRAWRRRLWWGCCTRG